MGLTDKFGSIGRQCALDIIAKLRELETDEIVGKFFANKEMVDHIIDIFESVQIDDYIMTINKRKKDYSIDVKFKSNDVKFTNGLKIYSKDGHINCDII